MKPSSVISSGWTFNHTVPAQLWFPHLETSLRPVWRLAKSHYKFHLLDTTGALQALPKASCLAPSGALGKGCLSTHSVPTLSWNVPTDIRGDTLSTGPPANKCSMSIWSTQAITLYGNCNLYRTGSERSRGQWKSLQALLVLHRKHSHNGTELMAAWQYEAGEMPRIGNPFLIFSWVSHTHWMPGQH